MGTIDDVKPYYGAADALVLPTLYDPFPNVALEAMACGLPVVTSTTSGAAELIANDHNGYVCDALDVETLATHLRSVVDPARHAILCVEARRTVELLTLDGGEPAVARSLPEPGALTMWKRLTRKRLQANAAGNAPLTADEIGRAASVLFAVFARYGDSVITFKLLREFARVYPDKKYLLITSPQALPYAEAILPPSIRCVGFDKHRDLFGLWRLTRQLKREPFAVGLNPWSHGQGVGVFYKLRSAVPSLRWVCRAFRARTTCMAAYALLPRFADEVAGAYGKNSGTSQANSNLAILHRCTQKPESR